MSRPVLNVLKLPRVSPMAMLHLEEMILRYDPQQRNFLILNHPRQQHRSVILGVTGKPEILVNEVATSKDNIPLIKRYTGGGTVYINESIRFNGFVMNKSAVPEVLPFPGDIMKWTESVYKPVYDSLVQKTAPTFSQLNASRDVDFSLRENDYVFGNLKFGGNAQSLIRTRWTHHTSFLWELDIDSISKYLTLPDKRPEYRQARSHRDFLTPMRPLFDPTAPWRYTEDAEPSEMLGGCLYTQNYYQHVAEEAERPILWDSLNVEQQELMMERMMSQWEDDLSHTHSTLDGVRLDDLVWNKTIEHLDTLFLVKEVGLKDVEDVCFAGQNQPLGTKIISNHLLRRHVDQY